MKKVLMVISPRLFQDFEYYIPRKKLEAEGFQIKIASKEVKEAIGGMGTKVQVDFDIKEVDPEDFDMVIFVGGPGARVYFKDKYALNIAKKAKKVAAICIAPLILANAGVLKGKKATVFPVYSKNLEEFGAIYSKEEVVQDGNIITACGPEAVEQFADKIIKLLKK